MKKKNMKDEELAEFLNSPPNVDERGTEEDTATEEFMEPEEVEETKPDLSSKQPPVSDPNRMTSSSTDEEKDRIQPGVVTETVSKFEPHNNVRKKIPS